MINGVPAPINFVSATQLSVVVPFSTQSVAQIQLFNNGAASNTVTQFVGYSSPGVFTFEPVGGIGYADALDVTNGYSLVTSANPAQIGDTVAVYLAGLGSVSGSTAAGSARPQHSSVRDGHQSSHGVSL